MAQQDIRYYLNGLLVIVAGNEIRVVATDGHRLAYAAETLTEDFPRTEVILPRKTVLELSRRPRPSSASATSNSSPSSLTASSRITSA
jgi:DNA polymerase-3 subunit beta